MPVRQKEIARRLRAAREASGMTQEEVARGLGVSRSSVAQMELGKRGINSLELEQLAYLYGRDIGDFFEPEFEEADALVAVFRRTPDLEMDEETLEGVRECLALGHELARLERLLEVERDAGALAAYPLPAPRNKGEGIRQGEAVAREERRRLGLGHAPAPNLIELLETLGVRAAQAALPKEVSGMTLIDPGVGVFVVANLKHHVLRRRFSYAHEYCHALLDRDSRGAISRASERDDPREVRANAFAAAFLMPEEGVHSFVQRLAKGRPSRTAVRVFDEEASVIAETREAPGSQVIQLYDVVHLAHHFGVSRLAALYRLRNLRLVTEDEFERLKAQDERSLGKRLAKLMDLEEPDHRKARDEFRHRFMNLAFEAYRREKISRAKLAELAEMVDVSLEDLDRVLAEAGLDETGRDWEGPE